MKKSNTKLIISILIAFAGYVLISFIGLTILISSSINTQKPEYATKDVIVNSRNGWVEELREKLALAGGGKQVYDNRGSLVINLTGRNAATGGQNPIYADYSCERFVESVKTGKIIKKFDLVKSDTDNELRVVYVFGSPVKYRNEVIGELFSIQSPLYFGRTLKVFLIFLTAAYIIAAASVLVTLGMRRRYENARQKYIDNVTHALKTPVTAIKALAETLYDGAETDPQEQQDDLRLILQQADLQVEMVQNILSLSRLQTYWIRRKKMRVMAEELIHDPVKKHIPSCEQKMITMGISDNIPSIPELYTEPDAIRQVIDVVLDNAVKFTPAGGSVFIDCTVSGKKAVFSIKDTGKGISKDIKNKIFDRFYTSSVGNSEGNGLGLAIAKEYIKILKERIWVESEPGLGTTVFFTVKIR